MGRSCIISNCPNRKRKGIQSIHRFPNVKNLAKRNEWLRFAASTYGGSLPTDKVDNYGVCSIHFTEEEYDLDESGSVRLKSEAIPKLADNRTESVQEWKNLYFQSQRRVDQLILQIQILEGELAKTKTELEQEKECTSKLKSLFSINQVKLLLQSSLSFVHWSQDDICKALGLYSISKRAYEMVRNSWKIPLPSESTLQRKLEALSIEPGLPILPVLEILQAKLTSVPQSNYRHQCVIALDEISISPAYCYDKTLDQVFGDEKYVNVLSARGLFEDWKQPILYGFHISKSQILEVIDLLFNKGLEVAGIVTDMGPRNQALWKEFNVCQFSGTFMSTPTFFFHPTTGHKIYFFPDYPHLLKSLRNNFLDSGLILNNGIKITKELIIKLLEVQDHSDLKPAFKLTYKHVFLQQQERQNVKTAYELFSHTTATMLKTALKDEQHSKEIADFFQLINDLSDLMNTRLAKESPNPYQCPYGMHMLKQNQVLDSALCAISEMKVTSTQRCLYPFQKGLLISIRSLKGLYNSLSSRYPSLQYILTSRLNQDYLENFFSQIRGFIRFNRNPDAVDFKQRLKRLILIWNFLENDVVDEKAISHLNCSCSDDEVQDLQFHVRRAVPLRSSAEMTVEEFCQESGKEYLAGRLAKVLEKAHPELSSATLNEESRNLWISNLSLGGLIEPSTKWLSDFRLFEQIF